MENNKREWPPVRRPRRRGINIRPIALLLALVLLIGGAVGGVVAWLTSTTGEVKNTFTAADVEISLTETFNHDSDDADTEPDEWKVQMVPGKSYTKDPKVAVDNVKTDVDIYLFVKFEENNDAAEYLTYTSTLTTANGWTQGDGTKIPNNVWYRVVADNDPVQSWELLEDNTVTIKDTVTKENMGDAVKAELVYTAYAVQKEGSANAAEAWAKIGTP